MARQKQQGESSKSSQRVRVEAQDIAERGAHKSQGSFVEALNATQQHTVPVLPAYTAPRPPQVEAQLLESSPAPIAPTRASPQISYARPTLASGIGGIQRASLAPATPTPSGDATSRQTMAKQRTAQHTPARRMRDTPPREKANDGLHEALLAGSPSFAGSAPDSGSTVPRHAEAQSATVDKANEAEYDEVDLTLSPSHPTFVLPVVTGDRLPAVRPLQSEHQLAVRGNEESKAVFIRGASKLPRPHIALAPRRYGPRPFIVQFLVAMVTVMTLSAVLTLASPLGKGLAFGNGFQAYANAMPWVPTPTPTPKPTPAPQFYGQQRGVNPGQQVIIDTIKTVFGPYSTGALNIARCESGYDPNAYNSYPVAGSHAEGVFQILYPSTWSGTSYARYSPYDYNANIRAAYEIFHNDGYSWREWECKP